MPVDTLLGLIVGVGLSGLHAAAGLVIWRRARPRPDDEFYKLVLGGLGVRMALLLGALVLVLWLAPFPETVFLGALLATFVLGLGVEVYHMARRPAVPREPTSRP